MISQHLRKGLSFRIILLYLSGHLCFSVLFPSAPLAAHVSKTFYDPVHEFTHFLDEKKNEKTPELILETFGRPDRVARKLAGWEYWYYDTIQFNNTVIEDSYVKFIPFRYGQYISPRQYRRMKSVFLNMLFFPVLPFLLAPYPFSAIFLFAALGFCLYGVVRSAWKTKFFLLYVIVGILLALNGVIF